MTGRSTGEGSNRGGATRGGATRGGADDPVADGRIGSGRVGNGRVGIREVAEAAGVSVTTVSHALNDKGRLPQETRDHVRRVAERLGYRPSMAARSLGGGRSGLLGLFISETDPSVVRFSDFTYFTQLMMAASMAALRAGYALVLTAAEPGAAIGALPLDGALVVDPVAEDPVVRRLLDAGTPLVSTGRSLGVEDAIPWVDNDHRAGVRSVLDHFARRGARRIALLANPARMSYNIDVESTYREWCERHAMAPCVTQVGAELTENAGYAAALDLLASSDRPDAIYATYDRIGVGALMAARTLGIAVPEDLLLAVSATGSGDEPTSPRLTGLNLYPDQIGRRAAELLIEVVEGRAPADPQITVPTRLVARSSTRRRSALAAG